MNEIPHDTDLLAATRFVQAGRLTEATALLQRLLRGEPEHAAGATIDAPALPASRLIDLTPKALEVTTHQPAPLASEAVGTGVGSWPSGGTAATAQPPMPEALRSFLERFKGSGLGPDWAGWQRRLRHRTSCRRAPSSSPAPMETRPAAAPTSSTSPAPITARHCRWSSCCTAAPSRPTTSPRARG